MGKCGRILDRGNSRGVEEERSLLFKKVNEATVSRMQEIGKEGLRSQA